MYEIDQSRQLEVLRWLMYAWDNQWLSRTGAVYGPAEASKISSRVRSAFGKVEMKALLALVGKKQAASLPDAAEMLKTYFALAFGERGFEGQLKPVAVGPGGSPRLQVEVKRLTPFDALKKAASAAGENPALACELLWTSWLETLLPEAHIQVTLRSTGDLDLYQIDSLGESLSGIATPSPSALYSSAPLPVVYAPAQPSQPEKLAPPAEPLSPIAAALQIPLEQIAPPSPDPMSDPYASGPASYAPPPTATPPAPGLIGSGERTPTDGGSGRRISLNNGESAGGGGMNSLPLPPFQVTPPFQNPSVSPGNLESPPFQNPVGPPPVAPVLSRDPSTGRPLFANNLEDEARSKVNREKVKNPNLLARMMTSKQGRELLAKGPEQPTVPMLSVADSIDVILQRRLSELRETQPGLFSEVLRVVGGPDGDLQIISGAYIYRGVDELPPGPVQTIIRQAVQEWSDSQS